MTYLRVSDLSSLWPGEMMGVRVGSVKVLLANIDGKVVAYHDRCAHLGVQLSKSCLEGHTVTCSAHFWRYDLRTGNGENPSSVRLLGIPVKIEQDQILVDVGDEQ